MTEVTAAAVMNSESAMTIIAVESVKEVARVNNRTFEETLKAYKLGVPNVTKSVDDLSKAAIDTLVERLNK